MSLFAAPKLGHFFSKMLRNEYCAFSYFFFSYVQFLLQILFICHKSGGGGGGYKIEGFALFLLAMKVIFAATKFFPAPKTVADFSE